MNGSPSILLNHLLTTFGLKNDAALSRALEVSPVLISKMRNHKLPIGATFILAIHECFGIPVAEVKSLAGIAAYVVKA